LSGTGVETVCLMSVFVSVWVGRSGLVMGSGVCACLVGLLAWSCRGMVYASVVAGFVMGVLCCR